MKHLLIILLGFFIVGAAGIKLRYGGGEDFPDRTGTPALAFAQVETVAELPSPPGNLAVSADGRLFFSFHPEARPAIKLAQWRDGQAVPFPNEAFQTGEGEARYFRSVLGIRIDRQNRLWTLDNGHHGFEATRLLAFDINSDAVVHEYVFPHEIAGLGSHLNDFQVSPDGRTIYIADASIFGLTPALVVYDVAQKKARRVLEGHASVTAENYLPVVQGRRMEIFGLFGIRPGVDSIGLDKAGEWLYFAPVTALKMYRILAADLRNPELDDAALAARVEAFADKSMSDGITLDRNGTIYISDPEHSAVLTLNQDRQLQTLLQDEHLRWPDGFSFGPDGWLYMTCSSLQTVIGRPASSIARHAPYQIYRFRPGAEGVPGH